MNEQLKQRIQQLKEYWSSKSKTQKRYWLIGLGSVLILAVVLTTWMSIPNYVPIYTGLSPEETGQIKESLDSKGISYEIGTGGTTIKVPSKDVDTLKVQLASEGIPKSGAIDYSSFWENAGFGMTDKEFNVVEREAMQTELSTLINSIDGIENSTVMINLPEKSVWVADENQTATASVVLDLQPGYKPNQTQINALYHLISKSIPSLPIDNIVIMDEFFNYYDQKNKEDVQTAYTSYEQQRKIKKDIEQDIQRQIQQMLATIMGPGKAIAIVTADIDFAQEKREESLVEPVDQENMEGLEVSVERIRESYTGENAAAGGVGGTGDSDVAGYNTTTNNGDGEFERIEERINNEFNRIRKEVIESPYRVNDLGIQVMVEPPNPNEPISIALQEDIEKILSSIVRTTIAEASTEPLTDTEIEEKITVASHQFNGKQNQTENASAEPPYLLYIVGAILVLTIIVLLIKLASRKKEENDEKLVYEDAMDEQSATTEGSVDVPDINDFKPESEHSARINQLEKMAKEKPEEFAKLLRTWLSEE